MLLQCSYVIIFFGVVFCQDDSFYFTKNPEDITIINGDQAILECAVSADKGIIYYWQHKGVPIVNTTRRLQVGSNLLIRRADRKIDPGEYSCIATNVTSGFSLTSRLSSVAVQWLSDRVQVILQTPTKSEMIEDGTDIVLKCQVEGTDEIDIEWFRNAERVSKSDRIQLKGKRLHLKSVTPRDNGVYRCSASNEAGHYSSMNTDNFILAIPGDRWAHIKVAPQDVLVKLGSSAIFNCVYENADVMEWYFRERGPLENNTAISFLGNGSLLLHKVHLSDEGLYGCVGIRGESTEIPVKYTAELQIAYLKEMTSKNLEPKMDDGYGAVGLGGELKVTCTPPAGLPHPIVYWRGPLSSVPLPSSGPIKDQEGTLVIESAKPQDVGNYTCIAQNVADTKQISFEFIVTTSPLLTKDPESLIVDEGETATFTCQFTGGMKFPITTVHWLKDNASYRQDSRLSVDQNTGTLTISNTQVSDKGDYSCLINTTGYNPVVSKPATLFIKEKLKFSPRPVDKKLELGSVKKVYCKAQGSTPPVIKWIKEGEKLYEFPEHIQDINGTLLFNGVKSEDSGLYMCIATNSQGVINTTIDIDVVVTPKFDVLPQNPTEAFEGYPIMLDCTAEGDPKPTIQWDKNSQMNDFDSKRFHVLDNGSLVIDEVHLTDEGKYGCTAGNSGGLKRYEISLLVRSSEGYRPDGSIEGLEGEDSMMTKTITITLSAAAAYMTLVIGLMAWCRYRRHRRKQAYLEANPTSPLGEATGLSLLGAKGDAATVGNCGNGGGGPGTGGNSEQKQKNGDAVRSDGENTAHSQGSNQSKRSKGSYDKLTFPRQDLQNLMLLGNGDFGEVYLAQAKGIREGVDTVVMVKALQQTRDEAALQEFKRQLDMFGRLDHAHISKLYGICRDAEPHYMILQYTDWGDLKQFLLATRKESKNNKPRPAPLTPKQSLALVHQLSLAMEHLSNHRLVHRDLGARNCLISSDLTIKVSFSALSKDTYAKEYFNHRNQFIPLRWLPLEAVAEDDYSCKSDVYSFAATVWEIYTRGELPFAKFSDSEVLEFLEQGELRWKHHKNMSDRLRMLLNRCWDANPRERPTFSQVAVEIGDIGMCLNNSAAAVNADQH
ncbi:inactive tyrosine-protein kinase 7-like [Lycorma delicatula]|uniref:inactive tyrosine-protein kinase 7-like n=1 Tax=Lycorma delicatula TaxID=130591 RepID=UPI003F50F321